MTGRQWKLFAWLIQHLAIFLLLGHGEGCKGNIVGTAWSSGLDVAATRRAGHGPKWEGPSYPCIFLFNRKLGVSGADIRPLVATIYFCASFLLILFFSRSGHRCCSGDRALGACPTGRRQRTCAWNPLSGAVVLLGAPLLSPLQPVSCQALVCTWLPPASAQGEGVGCQSLASFREVVSARLSPWLVYLSSSHPPPLGCMSHPLLRYPTSSSKSRHTLRFLLEISPPLPMPSISHLARFLSFVADGPGHPFASHHATHPHQQPKPSRTRILYKSSALPACTHHSILDHLLPSLSLSHLVSPSCASCQDASECSWTATASV